MGGSKNPVTLTNSIVVNNTAGTPSERQVGYQPRDGGGNIEFPAPAGGRRVAAGSRIVDPKLGALQTINGILVRPLLAGSPAINTGVRKTNVPTTDQRGYLRDGKIDVGAFEVGATARASTARTLSRTTHSTPNDRNQRALSPVNATFHTSPDLLTGFHAGAIVGTSEPKSISAQIAPRTANVVEQNTNFGLVQSDRLLITTGLGTEQLSIAASHPLQTTNSTQSFISFTTVMHS